jgi:hypothetical protein
MTDMEKLKQLFNEIGLKYDCLQDDWIEINNATDCKFTEHSYSFVFDKNGALKNIITCDN